MKCEKEYWLDHQIEPESEIDRPLNDIQLMELQGHIRDLIENGITQAEPESLIEIGKFLERNFI